MDPHRYSLLAHGDLPVWNPVEVADFDPVLERAEVPDKARILDVGCGPGGLLLRTLGTRPRAEAVGVDSSAPAVARAREAALLAGADRRVAFHIESFDPGRFEPGCLDLVLCVGSSHAAGGPTEAPGTLAGLLRPGGALILGEGFWEREPEAAYLDLLGARREDYPDLGGIATPSREAGLVPELVVPVPRSAWDRYEASYAANVEAHVAAHPDDPDAEAMLVRIRTWRDGYLRWGRATLGFALVLARKPPLSLDGRVKKTVARLVEVLGPTDL